MKIIKKILHSPFFYIIVILAVLRIILGSKVGVYYPSSQAGDDQLLAKYSMMITHFTVQDVYSMVKTMGYPVFVDAIYYLHIKYSVAVSLIWLIDALFVAYIIYKLSNKKWLGIFSYIYVLFAPMAFELWLGTRMYRNSIIAPFVLLVFCLILRKMYSLKDKLKVVKELIFSILLGLVFTFTYYIKEDGLWILCCLLLAIFIEIVYLLLKRNNIGIKKCVLLILISLLPVFIFKVSTIVYKEINNKYFGVKEIETKSGGELGKFINNIYKIDSDNRTSVIWAPKDSIEKAFEASKTLNKYSDLKHEILYSEWTNGDYDTPIYGDFLTWVMRTSLTKTGIWGNEKQINDLFGQINKELNEAFKSGKLKKSNRIQLLSSAGGRTKEEILDLIKPTYISFRNTLLLEDYNVGIKDSEDTDIGTVEHYAKITRESYILGNTRDQKELKVYSKIIEIMFWIYRIINPILFIALIINIIIGLYRIITKDFNDLFRYLVIVCMFMISIAYAFSISWFTEFIHRDGFNNIIQNFYCVALPVLLVFPYLLSIDMLSNKKEKRSKMKKEDKLEKVFKKCLKLFHINLKEKTEKLLLQIFKFTIVGGTAFVIDYVTLIICKEVFHMNTLLAAAIAFTVSVVVNYILSIKWVFEVSDKHSGKRNFIIFIIFSLMGLGLTELIMWVGEDLLKISYLIVKIIATIIVMIFNFVTRKIFLEK